MQLHLQLQPLNPPNTGCALELGVPAKKIEYANKPTISHKERKDIDNAWSDFQIYPNSKKSGVMEKGDT